MATVRELVFVSISGRGFAIPAERVREVLPMVEPTPVPAWPDEGWGVIDVRGELVPVVDVAPLLRRPPSEISVSQYILVLEVAGRAWGAVVDRIDTIRACEVLPPEALAPPEALSGSPLCVGAVHEGDSAITVLEPEGLIPALQLAQGPAGTGGRARINESA